MNRKVRDIRVRTRKSREVSKYSPGTGQGVRDTNKGRSVRRRRLSGRPKQRRPREGISRGRLVLEKGRVY